MWWCSSNAVDSLLPSWKGYEKLTWNPSLNVWLIQTLQAVLSVLHCLEYGWKKTFLIWIWHLFLRYLSKIDSCYFLVWFTRVWRCLNSHEGYLVYQKGEQPHIGNSIDVGTAQQKVAKTRHKNPQFFWHTLFVMWPKLCTRTPQFHWQGLFVRRPKLGTRF